MAFKEFSESFSPRISSIYYEELESIREGLEKIYNFGIIFHEVGERYPPPENFAQIIDFHGKVKVFQIVEKKSKP